MSTFHIQNFGCRATQADAAAIEWQLLSRGFAVAADAARADVVVVNTCTVTAAADSQARGAIRETARRNPGGQILVTGCYAQRAPEELAALPGVAWVVGNSHQSEIPRLVTERMERSSAKGRDNSSIVPLAALGGVELQDSLSGEGLRRKILTSDIFEMREFTASPMEGGEGGHTRPTLKIQDGCDNRCAYCVIPYVRGGSRSLPSDQVVRKVSRLVSMGAEEIVLSGINLGTYGRDLSPRTGFSEILRRILAETDLPRLRISSIEPMDVTQDLIGLFAASDRIARHFHIPLQSGSDRVLAAMHRRYRAEHFARRVELIRELMPDAAIGADVIAGFPGETSVEHRGTMELIESLPLTYLHVFSFSARPGTAAAHLPGEVPAETIRERARELRALGERKKSAFARAQAGKWNRVLTLHSSRKVQERSYTRAISTNYLDLCVAGSWPANQWLDVRIESFDGARLTAIPSN
jgi:threonylcarbamoyladenosine tRNA methylthiotransferase MtaB